VRLAIKRSLSYLYKATKILSRYFAHEEEEYAAVEQYSEWSDTIWHYIYTLQERMIGIFQFMRDFTFGKVPKPDASPRDYASMGQRKMELCNIAMPEPLPAVKDDKAKSQAQYVEMRAPKILFDTSTMEPAFLEPEDYPEEWLIYDPIKGIIRKEMKVMSKVE